MALRVASWIVCYLIHKRSTKSDEGHETNPERRHPHRNLFRNLRINQARLASTQDQIINAVTGQVITTNTPADALLRAPYQGADIVGF